MEVSRVNYSDWVGRSTQVEEVLAAAPARGLAATLDYPMAERVEDQPLPPCWHWLYFLSPARASEIDRDGHPRRGDFLPPITLPRRMWAGGRLTFHAPLHVGEQLRRVSTIQSVSEKTGRSGELVFVTLLHEIFSGSQLLLEEEQDLVYRGAVAATPQPDLEMRPVADCMRTLRIDPVLLFRYSALTFNSHRIHYDRDYARDVEGYAGLVVQGPLIATLLLDLLRREYDSATVQSFVFRAVNPLVDSTSAQLFLNQRGNDVELWAEGADGVVVMRANAVLVGD